MIRSVHPRAGRARRLDPRASPRSAAGERGAGEVASVVAAAALAALALAGCTNPFSPEGTEPGVYKGVADPLTEGSVEERDATLRERFELIQSR